jgi:YfiH family protein
MSTRQGGASVAPWDSMNLSTLVGDDPEAVARNRQHFEREIAAAPVLLTQVHGTRVVRITARDAAPDAPVHEADASVTDEPAVACAIQVADCLPLLLAAIDGRAVAAAHAGWRGLAAGVIENTLRAVCEVAACEPAAVQAWLGACIGPRQFEVGADVLQAFGVDPSGRDSECFVRRAAGPAGTWRANLPQLARQRLRAAGVTAISGGTWCTVEDASRFFSFRREGVTGRMVAAIWICG